MGVVGVVRRILASVGWEVLQSKVLVAEDSRLSVKLRVVSVSRLDPYSLTASFEHFRMFNDQWSNRRGFGSIVCLKSSGLGLLKPGL